MAPWSNCSGVQGKRRRRIDRGSSRRAPPRDDLVNERQFVARSCRQGPPPRSRWSCVSDLPRRGDRNQQRRRDEAASEGAPREGGAGDTAYAFKITDLRSPTETVCECSDAERSAASCLTYVGVELRQRSVSANGRVLASADDATSSCGSTRESAAAAAAVDDIAAAAKRHEANGGVKKLEKEGSLDWKKYMKENGNILGEVERLDNSLFSYFLGELYGGNALRSTIAVGNEKKRQRVYNTMFHVPWRCERDFGQVKQSGMEGVYRQR